MVMNGGTSATPVYLVVDNSATNAITRTTGWIISEGQYRYVKWNCGITTGAYVFPFGYSTSNYIPLTFNKTTAGSASVSVSTWASASNNTPWAGPSDGGAIAAVTNMYTSNITPAGDGSVQVVVDRWWDMYTWGAAATANVTFSYRGDENTMQSPDNTGIVAVQHWNGTVWNDGKSGAQGTNTSTGATGGITAGTVYTATATGLTEFSPYILGSLTAPLPVEFLSFDALCSNGNVLLKWSTASEFNSSHFIAERSADGNNFSSIGTVPASGNSSTVKNYSFTDNDPLPGAAFYRITEVDLNGNTQSTNPAVVASCSGDNIFVYSSDGGIYVNILASAEGKYRIELYNVLGQSIAKELRGVKKGDNIIKLLPEPASGMYFVTVKNHSNTITKKVFIRSDY